MTINTGKASTNTESVKSDSSLPLFLSQQDALFLPPESLGGKAMNLAWLSREGFPVPRWWVLTTEAFQQLLEANQLDGWIEGVLSDAQLLEDSALLEAAARAIRERVLSASIPESLIEIVTRHLAGQEDCYFAVRSSVLGEDALGASFAGQMDSYLFQRGLPAILESILQVAASAFNARALQYRISKGIALAEIRAAVIVQEMVEGEISGVMFTAHPMSGSRRHALISATFGVGEGVVSGICNTDEYTVGLFDDSVVTTLGDKDLALVFDHQRGRGTCEVSIEAARRKVACLDHRQLLALRDMGKKIAGLQKFPQDIEWTIRKGVVHILQTRPVTRLPPLSESIGEVRVFDNSNIQESYCGVTTPLTFSFASRAYETVYEQTMRLLGVSERSVLAHRHMLENMLGLVRGRVYYNINHWYQGLLLLPSFRSNKADMERMMGLTDPVDLVQDKNPGLSEKLRKLPQVLRALLRLLYGFQRMNQDVQKFRAMFETVYCSVSRPLLHTLTPGELIAELRRLDRELLQRWTTPIVNDFYVMMMNGRVHRALVAAGFEQPAVLQNNLLSGEEGIESTEPTRRLLQMCDYVRKQPPLRNLLEDPSTKNSRLLDRIQVLDPVFYAQCEDFIERYGDRTIGELKLESVTLRQDSSFLFAVLRNYLARTDLTPETLAANEARFRHEAEAEAFNAVRKQLGVRALKRFQKHLSKLRDAIRNRENMRLARTRMFGLYRELFLELGQQWAMHGLLSEPRDIFWLSVEEIYALNDGRAVQTNLLPLVAARKEEYAGWESRQVPEPAHHFHTHDTVSFFNDYTYPFAEPESSDSAELIGTGCYPGIVDAKVRLIFSPDDELALDGQILCTVRTDPGWAPLFPTAGGILVERGSTLSHSAVVARELGIPAIVGIPDITRRVRDGERVIMDGAKGTVRRVEFDASVDNDGE
ncbi:phosphoenolpyruvate synthase like [gamma proteobacterium HdN1]|nr:phosphoenolpyruvate synthase like [gamma proteobacterium HdN1]